MNREQIQDIIEQVTATREGYHPLNGTAAPVETLLDALQDADEHLPKRVRDTRDSLEQERIAGIKSHLIGIGDSQRLGNNDHCGAQMQGLAIASGHQRNNGAMLSALVTVALPIKDKRFQGDKRKRHQTTAQVAGKKSSSGAPQNQVLNQAGYRNTPRWDYTPRTLETDVYKSNDKAALEAYAKGKTGDKSVSIGQRAILFSASGTAIIGTDAIYKRGTVSQYASSMAVSHPPLTSIPAKIKYQPPTSTTGLSNASTKVPVAQNGDTVANGAKLLLVAGVISAVMFAIQYVISIIAFIMQVTQLMATVSNIYRTVLAMFDNIMIIFGVKDATKPASDWLDGMLSNTFGKKNAAYIKYNFAKCVNVFQAGANLLNNTKQALDTLAEGVDDTNQNVGRIGNAMRRAGLVSAKIGTFLQDIKIAQEKGSLAVLNRKLSKVSQVANDLQDITDDLQSTKEKDEANDKALEKKLKEIDEEEKKQTAVSTPTKVTIPALKQGDL
jgi:hypothetical protein